MKATDRGEDVLETARAGAATHFIVDGRRWRCSDPAIPPRLRQELVNELMAARRAVAAARSERETEHARRRVQDAKLALGERGRAWWLPARPADLARRIDAAILALLRSRRGQGTICPSEPARVAGGAGWRALMAVTRERAARLAAARAIDVLRRGEVVRGDVTSGVLRYRLIDETAHAGPPRVGLRRRESGRRTR